MPSHLISRNSVAYCTGTDIYFCYNAFWDSTVYIFVWGRLQFESRLDSSTPSQIETFQIEFRLWI